MKNNQTIAMALCVSALSAAPVTQADNLYAGVSYAWLEASGDADFGITSRTIDLSLEGFYGRFGGYFNDYLSLEGRVGVGSKDDKERASLVGVIVNFDGSLENFYGVYGRLGLPAGDIFYPYVIAGYTQAEMEVTVSALNFRESDSESDSDLSLGLGLDVRMAENFSLNFEYMNYLDTGDDELTAFAVGAVFAF